VVVVLWTIITFNSIWLATGLYLSLRLKKVTFAVILNLLLPMLAYIMVPVVLVIMQELLLHHSSHLYEWGMIYLPYPYFDAAIEGLTRHRSSVWLPVQGQVSSDEFLAAVTLVGTGLLLASALMICGLILRFNRIVKRASQDPGEQTRPVLAPPTPAV